MKYAVLLRGINVGGNNLIKMVELRSCLENAGFDRVKTYIQSGNIIITSDETDKQKITDRIEQAITKAFTLIVPVVVISYDELKTIVDNTPAGWGDDPEWKFSYLFLKPPYDMNDVIASIGQLKPGIETLTPGEGVLYQSLAFKLFGHTTTGKLASMPVYKMMTIRNHRTVPKLLALMAQG
ncbi:MAG: DUF1697 domain-containing protein [Candidatus Saccharimonadales bacterium]